VTEDLPAAEHREPSQALPKKPQLMQVLHHCCSTEAFASIAARQSLGRIRNQPARGRILYVLRR